MECFCGWWISWTMNPLTTAASAGGVLMGLVLKGFLKQDGRPRSSQSGRKSSRSSWNMEMDIYKVWSSYGALCLVVPKCSESCWEDVVVNSSHDFDLTVANQDPDRRGLWPITVSWWLARPLDLHLVGVRFRCPHTFGHEEKTRISLD